MARRNKRFKSLCRCAVCGTTREVLRKSGKKKEIGHKKDMFCPGCGQETEFVED